MKINLIEYFVETANRFPDRVAIVNGKRRLSFAELDLKTCQLAKVIVDTCQCKNVR